MRGLPNGGANAPTLDQSSRPAPNEPTTGGAMTQRHVLPNRDIGGWDVTEADERTTAHRADCQADAVNLACTDLRHDGGGQVLIHGIRGELRDTRTIRPTG